MKLTRLRTLALVTSLLSLASLDAQATVVPTPPPPPASPPSPVSSTSEAQAGAGAAAGAQAGSKSGAAAESISGAQQGQGQGQQQGLQNQTNNASRYNAFAVSLPTPVFTPPMAPVQCPEGVEITQSARAALWNGFSKADSHTSNADCVVIKLVNALVEDCQYLSARQARDKHLENRLPGYTTPKYDQTKWANLDPDACASVKRLALTPPLPPTTYNLILPPHVEPKPPVVVKKKRKYVAPLPQCGEGEVRACTKKPALIK